MFEILGPIAQAGGVVAVLIAGIYYFFNKEKQYLDKEKSYQTQINDLNVCLRDNERETMEIIGKLTQTLDKVITDDAKAKSEIIDEIRIIRDIVTSKLDSIKDAQK